MDKIGQKGMFLTVIEYNNMYMFIVNFMKNTIFTYIINVIL